MHSSNVITVLLLLPHAFMLSLVVGYPGLGSELLAIELVLGQVRVTAHTRGLMESAQTAAVRTLSDGQWHTITMTVTEQVYPVCLHKMKLY